MQGTKRTAYFDKKIQNGNRLNPNGFLKITDFMSNIYLNNFNDFSNEV